MEILGNKWLDATELLVGELRASWRNSTGTRLTSPHGKLLLLEVLVVLMCVGAVMGNILVIVIVVVTKTFHCVTSVLIINLAISDFLVGIGVVPFVAVSILNNGWVNCTDLCLYVGYTSSVYCTASVLTLAAIALDRYYSIVDCLHYNSRCTVWRSGAAVVWIWLQAMLTSSPPLLGWSNVSFVAPMYSCAVNLASSPSYTFFMVAFSFLLPATVILFCYLKIVRVARHHAQRIHSIQEHLQHSRNHAASTALESVQRCSAMDLELHDPSRLVYYVSGRFVADDLPTQPTPRLGEESNSKRSRWFLNTLLTCLQSSHQQVSHPQHHGVMRLFMVIAAFFLCWTPYISVALVQAAETALSRSISRVPPAAVTFSYWLVLFNSDINPLLYALLSKRFQGALQNLKRKIQSRLQVVGRADGGFANNANVIADIGDQHPRAGVAHQTGSGYSSVFTMNATFQQNYTDEAKNVLLPGSVLSSSSSFSTSTSSRSLWPNCQGKSAKKSDCLQVPSRAQDQDRMHSTSTIKERQATFFYGQITVRVEHDIC